MNVAAASAAATAATRHDVLLHAERTADPRVVRWVVRGHVPGPCVEPVCTMRGTTDAPPFVARVLDAAPDVAAVTVHAEQRDGIDVLRVDVGIGDAARWAAVAVDVQAAVRAAAHLRWWPELPGGAVGVAVALGRADDRSGSLPSGPCRSCPRSSSRTSTCGKPPGRPPAST